MMTPQSTAELKQQHEQPQTHPVPDAPTCEQCAALLNPADCFCTNCGAVRPDAPNPAPEVRRSDIVRFADLLRRPFQTDSRAFWGRALRCAAIMFAGLISFALAVRWGVGSTLKLTVCLVSATASAAYVLFAMRHVSRADDRDGSKENWAGWLRPVMVAGISTVVLYLPAVMLGAGVWRLCYAVLGWWLAAAMICLPFGVLMMVTAALGGHWVVARAPGASVGAPLQSAWRRCWHRHLAVCLWVAACLPAAVPVCLITALASNTLARRGASAGKGLLEVVREIAKKLIGLSPPAPATEGFGDKVTGLLRRLAVALFVKFPAAVAAYWYGVMTVGATLMAHACRGDAIAFRAEPEQAQTNGESHYDQVDQRVASEQVVVEGA